MMKKDYTSHGSRGEYLSIYYRSSRGNKTNYTMPRASVAARAALLWGEEGVGTKGEGEVGQG